MWRVRRTSAPNTQQALTVLIFSGGRDQHHGRTIAARAHGEQRRDAIHECLRVSRMKHATDAHRGSLRVANAEFLARVSIDPLHSDGQRLLRERQLSSFPGRGAAWLDSRYAA